jgi:predicted outer membrane repeat protein
MAYVEVWKSGKLLTRRRVDEEKARKGCRIRLGSAGEVRVAVGQTETIGMFEVRMFEGELPVGDHQIGEAASRRPHDEPRLPPLSVRATDRRGGQINEYPDIKGYKIIEPLGRGGMGMVWRAEQLGTRRQVALKLAVSHRIESPKAQALFQREVELTARLDHPHIARIYDSGLHQGMYYYAMELVDGMPLDQYVRSKALSRNEILVLMQTVCQAVLFAHLRAVIHRDLKPSNILVSPDGQPHVLDFGLAKGLLEEEDAFTISVEGQIAGTPAYMSPEQAAGHHSRLDTRTDVFSLGVILYELLMGQSPHDLSGSMFDVLYRITEGRIRRPREVDKSIDGELEAILLTALAQNPDDRYPSAGALAKDISNYLDGEPLDAQVHTIRYFLCKKALKYRIPVAIGLTVCLVLFGTILVAYTKVVSERAISESKDWEIKLKSDQLTWHELERKALSKNEQEARAALRIIRDEYVAAQNKISRLNLELGEKELPVVMRRVDLTSGAALASTALVRKPLLPDGVQSWTLETYGHRGSVARLAYRPDGSELLSVGGDEAIRTWDAETGKLTKILVDPNKIVDLPQFADGRNDSRFSWSSDESAPAADEIITQWEVDLPDVWQLFLRTATAAALSPDRTMLAFGDRDGMIRAVDLKTGRLRYSKTPAWSGPVHSVRFSSDGNVLATCSGLGTLCLWDAHRWQPLHKFEAENILSGFSISASTVAWSPSDTLIARPNNRQGALEILDSQSGQVLQVLSGNNKWISSVSWSPKGAFLAAGTTDGKIHLWDVESDSNEPSITLDAHAGGVNALAWKPGDQALISAGEDGKIEIWESRSSQRIQSLPRSTDPIACLALSPNGKILASGSHDGTICLWDVVEGRMVNILKNEPNDTQARLSAFTAVAWSADGMLLASGDSGGNIRIWNSNSRQSRRSFGADCGPISSLAWSPDGRILICGGADGTARAWDAKNDFQEHVVLLPLWGSTGPGIAVNREGDYRGPPGITDYLVYVVSTERDQETLKPADFKSRFGWVNESWQVGLFTPSAEEVKRIYVKADAQPPYDGNSWDTAFNDLQDALNLAQPNTEIWVTAGIYRPDRGTGAREASFHLKNGVRLFGGFAGTETSIDQRDPNRYETILSGDLKGDDGPDFANNDDNSYHVILASNMDSSTVLDGFVITGGNANGPGPKRGENTNHHGGGLLGGDLTVIRCTFKYNFALQHGGGIYHSGRSIMQNCTFTANRASYYGGAICSLWGQAIVSGSTFKANSADGGGGGVYLGQDSSLFTDCTFMGNFGPSGGGLFCVHPESNVILTNCRFLQNSAGNGGGIFSSGCRLQCNNCLFDSNLATSWGGGIYNNKYVDDFGHRVLSNCTIVRNKSRVQGCGIYSEPNCIPVFVNCIVWNNTDGIEMSESEQIHGLSRAINNCCIQGWTGKLGGTRNFGLDPLFVDPNGPDGKMGTLDDNLKLAPASPCRNAGENTALGADTADLDKDGDVNESIPFDIEGKPRILNGVVDLGAYESG